MQVAICDDLELFTEELLFVLFAHKKNADRI